MCLAAVLPQRCGPTIKLRMPRSRIRIMQAIIGGIIAGFGARLAMGCNHGGVLYRNSTVLAARPVLCHRHCHWFMVWRALYPAAHLPYSRENAEFLLPHR